MGGLSKFISYISSSMFQTALIVFALIVALGVAVMFLTEKRGKNKYIKRIEEYREFKKEDVAKNSTVDTPYSDVFNKYVRPYIDRNPAKFDRLMKSLGLNLQEFQRQLLRADVTNITPIEFAVLKIIGLFGFIFLILTTPLIWGFNGVIVSFIFFLALGFLPSYRLNSIYQRRKEIIRDILPHYLRLLANATSAGLTIEEAIRRISSKYPCLLSEEFKKAEKEAKYTNDWKQALENMAFRNDIDELYNLVTEINITKEKGTPISDVLVRHADKIEMENSLSITEKARKKATTIILPIFVFLFIPVIGLTMLPIFSMLMENL